MASEQRAVLKFCCLLGKSASETILMLKVACKYESMGKTHVYKWCRLKKKDRLMIKARSGRQSTTQTDGIVEKSCDHNEISWNSFGEF